MPTCLFTGIALDGTTKEEHTIPRSLGGRITSRDVSSSAFNQRCGERIDPVLAAVYAEVMLTLLPALPSEARSGSVPLSIDGQPGAWRINDRGQLELMDVIVERDPATGLPKSAIARNVEGLTSLIEQLGQKGVKVIRLREELPSSTRTWFPERAVVDWRVDVGLLKSLLLTFDERLKADPQRFTRSALLAPLRQFIRRVVDSNEGRPDISPLADYTLGLQYEPEYLKRYADLRAAAKLPETHFQHTLIVSGDPTCRTLDAVFLAFGVDPHAFRLSTEWDAGAFTYVLTNGVLANQTASQALFLPCSQTLGQPNRRRCQQKVFGPGLLLKTWK